MRKLVVVLALAFVASAGVAQNQGPGAAPIRQAGPPLECNGPDCEAPAIEPLPVTEKPPFTVIPPGYSHQVLHVKFREGTGMRLWSGVFFSLADEELSGLDEFLIQHRGIRTEPLFSRSPRALRLEKSRLEALSRRQQADKTLYYRFRLSGHLDAARVIDELNALDIVEIAYPEPLPMPPPVTDDFTDMQDYLNPAPEGVNAAIADDVCGGRGQNVKVIDIEYSWNQTHEDLSKAFGALIPNKTPEDPFDSNNHGTAVLGEIIADDNGFGVIGIVHEAQLGLVNSYNEEDEYDLQDSIDIACSNMDPGDVLLIEQQISGPNDCDNGVSGCVAVEWVKAYYDAIVACTSADIIVVEAAGNGAEDLDDTATYGDPFPDGRPDSRAIIVGSGGVAGCDHPALSRRTSSTFGSRVNLQGWGECVTTTGYGGLQGGDKNEWYTESFNGTSSASPIVASAAASVSSTYQALGLPFPTPPTVVRSLLEGTGTPQNFGPGTLAGHIGPQPDLLAALGALEVEPPELTCPDEVTEECTSPDGANVSFDVTATDDCDSDPEIECSPESGDLFPIATTNTHCSAEDAVGNTGHCFFDVIVEDTTPPDVTCPANTTVECSAFCGTPAADSQLVGFFDAASATDVCDLEPVEDNDAPACFSLGGTPVTFSATDDYGNVGNCQATVTVQDTIPPELEVTLSPTWLWPPNHKLVQISATVTVEDICDQTAGFVLTSITSNEPDNGLGDGDTPNDIQGAAFGTPDTSFYLRAERSGLGTGRVYTVVYTASDSSGNTTQVAMEVMVPHSKPGRQGPLPIETGRATR